MDNKFDFVVLGAHGSGLNAFNVYINMVDNVSCMFSNISKETINEFLNNNKKTNQKFGIIIDTKEICKNTSLQCLLENIANECVLVVLTRDPLSRIKSVMNTHIQWWADMVAGSHEGSVSNTMLYHWGDENSLLCELITEDCVNPVPTLYPLIKSSFKNVLFFDISDLYSENISNTFHQILTLLSIPGRRKITIPKSLPFSRQNTFVRYVKKLYLNPHLPDKDVVASIQPCPDEFCKIYGFTNNQIVGTISQSEYNFTLGEFSGDINLILCNIDNYNYSEINHIRLYILSNPSIIKDYINNLSKRHNFALQLANYIFINDKKLLDCCYKDKNTAFLLYTFLISQYSLVKIENPVIVSNWTTTFCFIEQIKSILVNVHHMNTNTTSYS